jgi:hypothetical protein
MTRSPATCEAVPAPEAVHVRHDANPLVSFKLTELLNHCPKSPQVPFEP